MDIDSGEKPQPKLGPNVVFEQADIRSSQLGLGAATVQQSCYFQEASWGYLLAAFCFAHLFLCAAAIFALASALNLRFFLGPVA